MQILPSGLILISNLSLISTSTSGTMGWLEVLKLGNGETKTADNDGSPVLADQNITGEAHSLSPYLRSSTSSSCRHRKFDENLATTTESCSTLVAVPFLPCGTVDPKSKWHQNWNYIPHISSSGRSQGDCGESLVCRRLSVVSFLHSVYFFWQVPPASRPVTDRHKFPCIHPMNLLNVALKLGVWRELKMEILTCEMKPSLKYLLKKIGERLDLPSDLAAISRDRRLASLISRRSRFTAQTQSLHPAKIAHDLQHRFCCSGTARGPR